MTPGRYNVPGMPGITASFGLRWGSTVNTGSGAISMSQTGEDLTQNSQTASTAKAAIWTFTASRSSKEYGAQTTVMPASVDTQMGLYLGRLT